MDIEMSPYPVVKMIGRRTFAVTSSCREPNCRDDHSVANDECGLAQHDGPHDDQEVPRVGRKGAWESA
jgi:hypothetical protein